jgi:hypothetical protein
MKTSKERHLRFGTTDRGNVPVGRNGKHKSIVTAILKNLDGLDLGKSLKIPLSELPDTKAKIRSALSRATRKMERTVATATDEEYLYVWNA